MPKIANIFTTLKHRLKKQRGVFLVEIAIVTVASSLMIFALATNYFRVENTNREEETRQVIETVKTAIVRYAAANTAKSSLLYNDDSTNKTVLRIPNGRPYLPCPDVTGDGVEDRAPLVTTATPPITLSVNATAGSYPLEEGGVCIRHKGLVPWKTLNTHRTDAWGNYLTYRVDPAFSNAMLGFDSQTRASEVLYTRPLSLTVVTSPTLTVNYFLLPIRNVDINVPPGTGAALTVWGSALNTSDDEAAPNLVCAYSPCDRNSPLLTVQSGVTSNFVIAGTPLAANATLRVGALGAQIPVVAALEDEDIHNSVPFVIVSHGNNGYGAVRGSGNIRGDAGDMICNRFPSGSDRDIEKQNAFRATNLSVNISGTSIKYRCPEVKPSDTAARINAFIRTPIADVGGEDISDDIVEWMSRENLVRAITQRGAKLDNFMPPIGLEDD